MVNSHNNQRPARPQQAHAHKRQPVVNSHQQQYEQQHYTHGYIQAPPQPVAYDVNGQPLYSHPPITHNPYAQGGQYHQSSTAAPRPHHYGHTPGNDPGANAYQHSEADQAQTRLGYHATSFVTRAPEQIDGHNYNPRIRAQYGNEPDIVHASRPFEPSVPEMSDKLRRKHDESLKKYPFLNLSPGEFVILQFRRHPIGLFWPVGLTGILLIIFISAMFIYPSMYEQSGGGMIAPASVISILAILSLLAVGLGWLKTWVYLENQFFLTNESVIQEIQHGPFSRHEQTVSLGSIEDASFKQFGLIPTIFNYGAIRLSTEGKDTVYRFEYVENPKDQVAVVTNAVDNFKNGRPVGLEALQEMDDEETSSSDQKTP